MFSNSNQIKHFNYAVIIFLSAARKSKLVRNQNGKHVYFLCRGTK